MPDLRGMAPNEKGLQMSVYNKITEEEAVRAGFEKKPLLKAIREKCLDCTVYQANEVRLCQIRDCSLWPYRMGNNPFTRRKGGSFGKDK